MNEKLVAIAVPSDLGLENWELEALLERLDQAMHERHAIASEHRWRVVADVPASLPEEAKSALLNKIARAAQDWKNTQVAEPDLFIFGTNHAMASETMASVALTRNGRAHKIAKEMLGQLPDGAERTALERIVAALEGSDA